MKPLSGVVMLASNRALTIELKSGLVVSTTNDYGLVKYDHVVVSYDYTENRVINIEPYEPASEHVEAGDLQTADVEENEPDDSVEEIIDAELDGSSALCLWGDEFWDPETGVVIAELDG